MSFLLAVATASLGVATVAAQVAPPQLSSWGVAVWPEYDRASVLVIAEGTFAAGTAFPQQVRVTVPARAQVFAVAYADATGNLLTLPWTSQAAGQDQSIVFDVEQPTFRVEYYDDALTAPPSRSFDVAIAAPFAAQRATVSLRQPSRASDLQTTPAMESGGVDSLGNPVYNLDIGALEAGQSVPLRVSYTKADADPSVSATPANPVVVTAAEEAPGQQWLFWGAAILAIALLGAVVVYLLVGRRAEAASRQARRREARKKGQQQPARPPMAAPAQPRYETKFCAQCGQKYESSDKFCRNCGAPRR